MALIKCKECGTEVSSKAKTCPKCGIRVADKQYGCLPSIVIIFLGLIIFVVLVGILYDSPPTVSRNPMDVMIAAARIEANKPKNNTLESKKQWLHEQREIALREGDLEAVKTLDAMAPTPISAPKEVVVNNSKSFYPGHRKGTEAIYSASIDNRITLILTTDINAKEIKGSAQYDEENILYNRRLS